VQKPADEAVGIQKVDIQVGCVFYMKTPPVPGPPPNASQCPVLAANCVHQNGKWIVCGTCDGKKGPATRAPLQTSLTEPYVKDLLDLGVTHAQMLSVIDVTVQFESKFKGYLQGNITEASHFDSPLLIYDSRCGRFDNPAPQDLLNFYALNMAANPVTTKYVPLLERPIPTFGVPYVVAADIDLRRLNAARARGPVPQVDSTSIAVVVPIDIPQLSAAGDRDTRTFGSEMEFGEFHSEPE
jgi:hypothetical protein